MNAQFIAVLLSLFIASISVHANSVTSNTTENKVAVSNPINLNKADVATLTGSFKGIGKKRAEAIIAYRESHNGFKSLEELAEIKGIGQHFMDTNREKLNKVYSIN